LPLIETGLDTAAKWPDGRRVLYLMAAAFNLYIPDTGVDHKPLKNNPLVPDPRLQPLPRACSGATSSARSRWPSPRCSGAPARRCSSS
jgi:hypothetical protein